MTALVIVVVRKCRSCNLPATNIFNSETDLENFAMGPTSSFVTALGDALFLTAPSNADMVEDTIVNLKDTKIRLCAQLRFFHSLFYSYKLYSKTRIRRRFRYIYMSYKQYRSKEDLTKRR
jgi:hypothetical protein